METISISKLKAHLSSELKKVRAGNVITVLDHNHPVAKIVPVDSEKNQLEIIEATKKFEVKKYPPLLKKGSVMRALEEDRADRW